LETTGRTLGPNFRVPVHHDFLDRRGWGPLAHVGDGRLDRGFLAHEKGLDPAVGQVADEAPKSEFPGARLGGLAKEDALDSATDENVGSEWFHEASDAGTSVMV